MTLTNDEQIDHDRSAQQVALRVRGITRSFGPVVALSDVSFDVRAGEIHGLVGENGAGKSTLIAVAGGVLSPDSGDVELNGQVVTGQSPQSLRDRGLSIVFQHPALLPDLTVAENLLLGVPSSGMPPRLTKLNGWARQELRVLGLELDPSARAADLDLPDKHLLEIAKATVVLPRVLVLDEPTEPLSEPQCQSLFEQLARLRERGVAVVYISHRLNDVRRVCDRLTVLRDGRSEGTFSVGTLDESDVLRLVTGRSIDAVFPAKSRTRSGARLRVEGLSGLGFEEVSLAVAGGEIVGLAGIEGNGQREFTRALAGLQPSSGAVMVDGSTVDIESPRHALDAGIVYLPNDRHTEGLMLQMSVRENMTLLALPKHSSRGWINRRAERETALRQGQSLAIKMESPDAAVGSLSGGNQQKTLFARAVLASPRVLLADEPTQGVDAGARVDLYRELRKTSDAGAAVVVVSSDAIELAGLCDRVLVFSRGSVVRELSGEDVDPESITHAALTATTTRSAERRRARGRIRSALSGDYVPACLLATVALLVGAYTATRSDQYLSQVNFSNFLYMVAVLGFVALAQNVAVLTGGIDLSIGPLIGTTTVIASYLMVSSGIGSMLVAVGVAAAVCLFVGAVNGVLVDKVRITPVIATLVTFFVLQGANLLIRLTAGGRITTRLATILKYDIGFVPIAFVGLVACAGLLEFGLRYRLWGIRLRAVGSDVDNAVRTGVNRSRVVIGAYVLCSGIGLCAGLLVAALIQVGDPRAGVSYTLSSIAAVVLGGTAVSGGRGSFVGAAAGAFVLQQTSNVSTFLQLDSSWQYFFVGLLTIGAASMYSLSRRT